MKSILSNVRATLVVALFINTAALAQTWIIDGKQTQVLKLEVSDPQAVYTDGSRQMTAPIKFTQSHTATNGALQIYAKDSAEHFGYFKSLSFQDGLQFSTAHSASLFFGSAASDGLLIGPSSIFQTGYGTRLDFETGFLTGTKWHVSEDPTEDSGIMNKGYADGRYLLRTTGITTNRVIQAGNTLVISNGLITAILP
jgi:hypothetical protein